MAGPAPGLPFPLPFPPGVDPETYKIDEVFAILKRAAYFPMYSMPNPAEPSQPIVDPDHPDRLVAVRVNEELHRLPVNLDLGDSMGEPVSNVAIRWTVTPDDFDPQPDVFPPPTPIDPMRSQKFVTLEGGMKFRDPEHSGFRAFGHGRTFPTLLGGRPTLLIGGVVRVLEGFGRFQKLKASLVVTGNIAPPNQLSLSIVARFLDPENLLVPAGGQLEPMQARPNPDPDFGYLCLLGEVDPDRKTELRLGPDGQMQGSNVFEVLRLVDIDFDVAGADGMRSRTLEGPLVGKLSAVTSFNPLSPNEINPASTSDGVFTIFDLRGREIGSIFSNMVDGDIVRTEIPGPPMPIFRIAGYGPVLKGTGVFEGMNGMMTLNAAISVFPRTLSNMYIFRFFDPGSRIRTALRKAWTRAEFRMPKSAPITADDQKLLDRVESSLAKGVAIHQWWKQKDAAGDYRSRFDLVRTFNTPNRAFGFFDVAPAGSERLPVLGIVQESLFDRPKTKPATALADQLREFVLHYFLRASDFHEPVASIRSPFTIPPVLLRGLSWAHSDEESLHGFGFTQHFFKTKNGAVGKFTPEDQNAILDLRDVAERFEWVVLKVRIFNFNLNFKPFGPGGLQMELPLREQSFLVLSPHFISEAKDRVGLGYAVVPGGPGTNELVAWGPGHFKAGFQTIDFRIEPDGSSHVQMAFAVDRPERILNVPLDPIEWGLRMSDLLTFGVASRLFGGLRELKFPMVPANADPVLTYIAVANFLTGGLAAERLNISKEQLERDFLVQHFIQHYQMITGTLLTWRTVANWLDDEAVPPWVRAGQPA